MLLRAVERIVAGVKGDAGYRIDTAYTTRQLAVIFWYRGWQWVRGLWLRARARGVHGTVFFGRRVVIEHAGQLSAGPGLILEDGVTLHALSRTGIVLGRNVTVARHAILTCTGVLAEIGEGIRVGDRSAIGAASFLGGQGGITIGSDVIMGPGVRIFSENHNSAAADRPIRTQGVDRRGVRIGDDCWIGGGVTILDGVTIGRGCVVAAGAVVSRDLPDDVLAAGVPARVVRPRVAPPRESPPSSTTPAGQ
jgi:acetyltransferase-like isoleucine patch superfamily enzyme